MNSLKKILWQFRIIIGLYLYLVEGIIVVMIFSNPFSSITSIFIVTVMYPLSRVFMTLNSYYENVLTNKSETNKQTIVTVTINFLLFCIPVIGLIGYAGRHGDLSPIKPQMITKVIYPANSNTMISFKTEKSCTKCEKHVPESSKVGDKCPHCGALWTNEVESDKNLL